MRWLYPKTGYVRTSHYKWIGWKAECFYGSTDFMKFDPIWGFWLWMPLTLPPVWVKVLATPQQRDEWSMAQDWWEGFLWHGRELNCIVLDLLDVNQRCKIIAPCSKQNHALAPSFAQEFTRRSCILTIHIMTCWSAKHDHTSSIYIIPKSKTISISKRGNCNPDYLYNIYIYVYTEGYMFCFHNHLMNNFLSTHILLWQSKHVDPHHMIIYIETDLTTTVKTCWYALHDHLT